LVTGSHYKFIAGAAVAGLIAERFLAPGCCWRAGHFVAAAVAAAVRVIGCIHNYTADCRADTHATLAAGFADLHILVLLIADYANRGPAFGVNHSNFAAGQAYLGVIALFGD
jgi:hypothetical protein